MGGISARNVDLLGAFFGLTACSWLMADTLGNCLKMLDLPSIFTM